MKTCVKRYRAFFAQGKKGVVRGPYSFVVVRSDRPPPFHMLQLVVQAIPIPIPVSVDDIFRQLPGTVCFILCCLSQNKIQAPICTFFASR